MLRYGWFYGPGTYFGRDGSTAEEVRRRRFPIVGKGTGVSSFIHVDDAAGGDGRRGRARRARASTTSSTTSPPRCASGFPSTPRRSERSRRAGSRPGWPGWSPGAGGGDGHGAARGLEREGEAGARLAAPLSELAPGLPRGLSAERSGGRPRRVEAASCSPSCASTRWCSARCRSPAATRASTTSTRAGRCCARPASAPPAS